MVKRTALLPNRNKGFPRRYSLCSAAEPVQSPQYFTFKAAEGTKETRMATSATPLVRTSLCWINLRDGATAISHGSSSGRFEPLLPVTKPTARKDNHTSRGACEERARRAKSRAARAKTAPNKSFPILPAWRRKQ